jgi:hypothetical protein
LIYKRSTLHYKINKDSALAVNLKCRIFFYILNAEATTTADVKIVIVNVFVYNVHIGARVI